MHEVAVNAVERLAWNVERITDDGAVEMAVFSGPHAEARARAYAASRNLAASE